MPDVLWRLYWHLTLGYLAAIALPWIVLALLPRREVVPHSERLHDPDRTQPRRLSRGDLTVIQGGKAA